MGQYDYLYDEVPDKNAYLERLGLADASACLSDNACRGPREEGQPFCCPVFAK